MNSRPNRLLIVDDNEMNRDMLARRLARKGYEISMAESAHGLLERVKQDGTDLVLLDIEMPEVSGLDALKTLRDAYSAIELPVIMVTAKNQSDDIVRDRKSTRLNSSHGYISYAVFCLKKKKSVYIDEKLEQLAS